MSKKLIITAKCLKDFLLLFDDGECLEDLILGDTWHPSSGLVDESILDGKRSVKEILDFDYDFGGLVEFESDIGKLKVRLLDSSYSNETLNLERYEISGTTKELYKLYNRAIERNGYCQNKYQLHFMKEWE